MNSQSSDSSELDVDETLCEDTYGSQARVVSDDEDYSSDSSEHSVAPQGGVADATQQRAAVQRGGRARGAGQEPLRMLRESAFPIEYRFADTRVEETAMAEFGSVNEEKRVGLKSLGGLVKYSSTDLLTRAWCLCPTELKVREYPLYTKLPKCPEVMETRFVDPDDVSHFMCSIALQLGERYQRVTPVYLRSLLVQAVVRDEVAGANQSAANSKPYADTLLTPAWEDTLDDDDKSDYSSDEADDEDGLDDSLEPEATVNAFDFSVALVLPVVSHGITSESLHLLHTLVNRWLVSTSSDVTVLQSWGVKRIMLVLLRHMYTRVTTHSNHKWIATTISLLSKIVITSGDTKELLSLLRWSLLHRDVMEQLTMRDVRNIVQRIEEKTALRVRLSFPSATSKEQTISLIHSVGSTPAAVKGLCVFMEEDLPRCIVFTEDRSIKVALNPPFEVIRWSSTAPESCRGVYVEENMDICVLGDNGKVYVMDKDTLMLTKTITPPAPPLASTQFPLYIGNDQYVAPYFLAGAATDKQACFTGDDVNGALAPSTVTLPRASDSLSVQFYLCPIITGTVNEMVLLQLLTGNRNWLTVSVSLNSLTSTMVITFRHGQDTVAEVRDTLKSEWALWSAAMTSTNETASWSVYKNGLLCDCRSQSGTLMQPTAALAPTLFKGRMSAYISTLQLWSRAQSIDAMRGAAFEHLPEKKAQFLVFSFRMDESLGCSLHSPQTGYVWQGVGLRWDTPPKPFPVARHGSRQVHWRPSGDYYIVTNHFEFAVIEALSTTWIDRDGRVVEQCEGFFAVNERPFYNITDGCFFLSTQDTVGLRSVKSNSAPAAYLKHLPSMTAGKQFCAQMLECVRTHAPISAQRYLEYLVYRTNLYLLTYSDENGGSGPIHLSSNLRENLSIVGRLLDMAELLAAGLETNTPQSLRPELVLCFIGRLLNIYVKVFERQCPGQVVRVVVDMHKRLHELSARMSHNDFLHEAASVFGDLNKTVLACCVSHDFQLKLINDSSSLKDVRQLLQPESLSQFVPSVIQKDMKKMFMTFLHRLKEECQEEAVLIFDKKPRQIAASEAMLSTLLGMLSQQDHPQWHLVAAALISSLCKWIMRCFEQCFGTDATRFANIDVLKGTSIGIVLFPVVHYMCDMQLDSAIAPDALKALNDARKCLSRYSLSPQKTDKESVSFTETHYVVSPPQLTGPFTVNLPFEYAKSIKIELAEAVEGERSGGSATVSLITNNCLAYVEVLHPGQQVEFREGARVSVVCGTDASPEAPVPGVSLSVHTVVELVTEKTDWVRDICLALSSIIIRVTQHNLHNAVPASTTVNDDSFLRGGLSGEVQRRHRIAPVAGDKEECAELHTQLCAVADKSDETLATMWNAVYERSRIQYAQRLENIMRWASCALAWHTLPLPIEEVPGVEKLLVGAVEAIKRKTFLLLEALQQGRGEAIVERARFLLHDLTPRPFGESQLTENQHTEEPLTADVGRGSRQHSRMGYSLGHRSRAAMPSVRTLSTQALDYSNTYRGSLASTRKTATRVADASPVNIFSKSVKNEEDTLPSQIVYYLINGMGRPTEDILSDLVRKTQQAVYQTAAYQLQNDLCESFANDREMLASILMTHLRYRLNVSQAKLMTTSEVADATGESKEGFSHHYTEQMIGCGMLRELELQRSVCSFVQSSLRAILQKLDDTQNFPYAEAVYMCATLCHPWDGVDMSILQPREIFAFLSKLFTAAYGLRLSSTSSDAEKYYENHGLFDLAHRCLVIPNAMLQTSVEGVHVVQSEVQGLHVENVNVVFSARTHWKAHGANTKIPAKSEDVDYYANYGIPCVISEYPDVQYFEATLDFALHPNNPALLVGVSLGPLSPLDPVRADYIISLASSGRVHRPEKQDCQLCSPWKIGDVIGCGLMAPSNSVFFTMNGEFLGVVAEMSSMAAAIPFVSVHGDDTLMKVIVNFGEEQPFKFDLASLHCSSRHRYLTAATVCDTVLITTDYLVTMCYKDLSSDNATTAMNGEAISGLLEKAALFLSSAATELMTKQNACASGHHGRAEPIVVLLSRLLHCISVVIECFRYDSVTPRTHAVVLQLCTVTITRSRDKWIKVRASQCLTSLCKMLRSDYLMDALDSVRGVVSCEDVVQQLVDLARIKLMKEVEVPMKPPRWVGDTTVVKGKGTFFGSVPLPKKGTHLVGFRIKRRQQQVQGPGAPLGGCYYLGLAHGQPSIPNMGNLISRNDVFVLQDTDDQDQVAHLLLRRHCIPRNNHRRVYGNDEVVWAEFNADYGEITFYRENMVLIGLAFANVAQVDDLYPIAFLFNDDASCEIIAPPSLSDESVEHWTESLRRSTAIDTLQELHMVPGFASVISLMVQRSVTQLDRGFDACLVALGVLGGERSYLYCQHDTFGMVVVHAIAEVTGKVVVYLASDEDKRLFSVQSHGLKPSFIQTPLYQSPSPDAHNCATLLSNELYKILYEASAVAPLLHNEKAERHTLESQYRASLSRSTAMNLIGILGEQQRSAKTPVVPCVSSVESGMLPLPYRRSNSSAIFDSSPVAIDLHCSNKTLYVPNPSVAVTTAEGCSVIRGNVQLEARFTLAVSLTQTSPNDLMYVGFTTTRMRWPESADEVASWDDAWALCCRDSAATNSVNCCMEPGIIFAAAEKLFQSGDVLLMRVNRPERTIAFTRVRNGEQTDFGVLFEGIPQSYDLRPMVVCGEESVVVFSTVNTCLFPARVTYPISNFNGPSKDRVTCTACARRLSPPWYGGEENVALCDMCFTSWKRPKDMFFVVSAASARVPSYLVSDHCPEVLRVGEYVEFEENTALGWSAPRSVNAEILGSTCIALNDESFAFSDELSQFGQRRVDIKLNHITGVPGHPFSGLHSFTPLWRDGQQIRSTCTLRGDCVAVSATLLPMRTKSFLCLHIDSNTRNTLFSMAEVFVGVTNLTDTSRPMSRGDLEQLCGSKNAWGAWCDTSEKVSNNSDVFILVDCLNNSIFLSSSLGGLHSKPFVISGSISADAEEDNLRLLVFSHDPCFVRSREGLVSYNECVEPSFAPVAIGLFPETSDTPSVDTFNEAIVLMDTVERTQSYTKTEWTYSPHVDKLDNGTLFYIGDTVTLYHDGATIRVYIQGLEMASLQLKEEQRGERLRVIAYLSSRGTGATIVPPLYGTSHLGRVTRVCGPDVAVVEAISETGASQCFAVRRSAVRFCAMVASAQDGQLSLRDGDPVAFKVGGLQISKRGTVASVQGAVVNVCESSDKRNLLSISMNQCFSLCNEGKQRCDYALYPLISPPTSSITRVFEVGKKKFRLQSHGSYNGIMFDCKTNETIEIIGFSVLTRVTGCHQVQAYFRKGSSANHERDVRSWTLIFEDMIDMTGDHQFSIPLAPIVVEGNTTFAFYINTSHNCGIGFYCEEDGCTGEIGQELDTDGTLSVCLGRKSGSSDPFTEFSMSPRGFCGTIQYKQNHGSSLPSIEDKLLVNPTMDAGLRHCSDSLRLICRPSTTTKDIAVTFRVRVVSLAVRIISFKLPVLLLNASGVATHGFSHCSISMFYSQEDRQEWQWVWNSRFLVEGDASEVTLSPANLCLEQGTYTFQVLLKNIESEGVGAQPHLCLLSSSDPAYERKNGFIAVEGFFGDVTCEANTPVLEGELHTMITGAHLSQSNSASYNGIMFDLRSKKEITLEEVFCISQTTSDRVAVRIFWKEGSMEGAEKSPHQWREVLTKEVAVVDKHPFSVGSLMLRMRANQVYSIFINTSSSCGVRFYNSSDGHVGDIRDEFDSDGILSVYVGRKSESSSPFVELPLEPRAFRGRITYRTYAMQNTETTECAIFPYIRGFLVTRMLVALMSYVELSGVSHIPNFSYEQLLKTISLLATSPMESVGDLTGAENMLASLIRGAGEMHSTIVTIPVSSNHHSLLAPLAKGDIALLTEMHSSEPNTLVRLHTHVQSDGSALVRNLDEEQPFRVPAKRLLPIVKCVACDGVYAHGICAACGKEHVPVLSEEARAVEIVANGLRQLRPEANPEAAMEAAVAAVGSARRMDGSSMMADALAKSRAEVHTRVTPGGVGFLIPVALFLSEEEYSEGGGFLCPFVYHPTVGAAVSLRVSSTNEFFSVHFVTDGATQVPPRTSATAPNPKPPRFLHLRLCGGDDEARDALMPDYVPFAVCEDGESCVSLIDSVHAGYAASLQRDGVVALFLEVEECAPLPLTLDVVPKEDCWMWENNSVEARLCPTAATYLQHVFSAREAASEWPHYSAFMVTAKGKETTIFLELHVAEVYRRTLSSSGMMGRAAPAAPAVRIRKPFNVQSDELLTLRVTTEGDFFLYDTNDIVRCCVSRDELYGGKNQRQQHKIGFVSVDPEKVTALLYVPERTRRNRRAAVAVDCKTTTTAPASQAKTYSPAWVKYDATRITVTRNGLTASFVNEHDGGDAVLGTPLPTTGVASFVVHIHRKDSQPGTPLGSGFFAGVALADFAQSAPEYKAMKTSVGSLWVVQDVQDKDSMPNQELLPPLSRGPAGSNVLFFDSTKIVFIVDRSNGTLSISRDNESPQVIFQGIPQGTSICPFVRLDHPSSSATLARFSSAVEYARLHQPSLEKVLVTQPITPSLLRRYPLFMAIQIFPFLSEFVRQLPTRMAGMLERCWNEQMAGSRFEHRMAQALEELTELGVFARSSLDVNVEKIGAIVDYLSSSAQREFVVFAPRSSDAAPPLLAPRVENVQVRLPSTYELVGHVPETNMVRVLYFDPEFGAVERTLHLFYTDDPQYVLRSTNSVLPHLSVMRQHELIPALNHAGAVAVIADGWFDCTLEDCSETLDVKAQQEIASSLVYGLEHWHLHQLAHGHVHPRNVYLRIVHGELVQCCMWDVHRLSPASKYASHELRDTGVRSLAGDRWGCWRILHSFDLLLAQNPQIAECVELMVGEATSISHALQLSEAFQDTFNDGGEGPTFSLRTGSRLRGGSGSYHGIMFDVVAKNNTIRISKLSFIPDTNAVATVRLYMRSGSFIGFERDAEAWTKVVEEELALKDAWEVTLENFDPITVPAGSRVGLFLHTTSTSGVLFFSENEGLQGKTGDVEEENEDIGITIGKKSESASPFVAVQSQKRLLKGSVTYTVLMRSNGPRSRLIYSSESEMGGGKNDDQVVLRLVQIDETRVAMYRDPHENGTTNAVVEELEDDDGAGENGGATSTAARRDGEAETPGFQLQVVDPAALRRGVSEESLVLWEPNSFQWHASTEVISVRPGSLQDAAAPLLRSLTFDAVQRRQVLLQQHLCSSRAFPCRPLHFTQLLPSPPEGSPTGTTARLSHPVLSAGVTYVSEPITTTCTLSIWQKATGACQLFMMDHVPTAEELSAKVTLPREFLVGKRSRGGFVYVDDLLRCVTSAHQRVHLRLRAPLSQTPIHVVARLRGAHQRDAKLFAYTNAVDAHLVTPVTDGCFFLTDGRDGAAASTTPAAWCASGCLVAFEGNDVPISGDESLVQLQSIVPSKHGVRFVRLPQGNGEDGWNAAADGRVMSGVNVSSTSPVSRSVPRQPVLVEVREQLKWKSVRHTVDFTCLSSALALCDDTSVRQASGGVTCAGVVPSPRFTMAERHRVLLRLQFPRSAPIELQLDSKNGSADPIRVLHGSYNSLRSRLFDPAVREVFVYLDVNLQTHEIVAVGSDGTVCHPFVEDTVPPSDTQLSFVTHAPGSQIDVLEWKVCSSQIRGEMNAPAFRDVLHETHLSNVSPNTSLTVGAISRHSARGTLPPNREGQLSTEKQMEVLMVTYARVLLEKTLLSQERARAAVQPCFLRLLSFTALRTHPDIARILDGEIKAGSFRLVCQSIAHLSTPFLLQAPAEAETSINVISSLMRNDLFRRAIPNAFGTTLVLVLLRAATAYTRSTRHAALQCVQELLADERIPLPPHQSLTAHLRPLTDMMASLCRGERMGSAVVQTGVTLIADLIERYHRERPTHPYRDASTEIPYKLVMCAREVVRCLTHDPPLPLPSAMVTEVRSQHAMQCEVVKQTVELENRTSATGVFTEEGRDHDGSMSFTVNINANRHGSVIVGWNSATRHGQQGSALPCFGYFVEARTGAVHLCYNHSKSVKSLSLRVNAGDELVTCANYRDHRIQFELKRGGITVGETKFDTEREVIGLPFFYAEHCDDAAVNLKSFRPRSQTLSIPRLYDQILQSPHEKDSVLAQSYDFYAELNLFVQTVLGVRSSADLASRLSNESTVASHELASFTRVSSVLNAGAFVDKISLTPLQPYFVRLKKLDELTAEFSPLINLRRRTELFDIFGVLKNLCARATEEQIQTRIMAPFQHRQGKKVSVTIHTMQAQPTSLTGPFPTLMRSVFGQLYLQLQQATIDTFFVSPIFTVKLAGFGSTDAGGPYRDVLSQLATEIMTTHPSRQCQLNPLFVNCGRGDVTAIMPNVSLLSSAQTPLMLEFLGKLLASFFLTQDLLAVELPPLFWKLLLGEEASIKDLATLDAGITRLLQPEELMLCTQEELEERFPGITEMWKGIVENNQQFLLDDSLPPETEDGARLLSRRIAASEIERFADAISYIQQGFDQVLPLYTLQAYRWQKVELLICGTAKLTFADFCNECDIQLTTPDANMFLSVLEGMTDEDRTSLLRFTTGQSRLPLKNKIKVTHNGNKDTLPTSSTCFFALRLPSYSSAEKMKERILYAVRQCKAIDADGQAREHLIID